MTTLTVYDPALCCSTGVCGPEIDQRLVDFAADLDWLKAQGAKVRRINLSQEPMEFVTQPSVKALMDASGGDDLPAIVIGERIVSQGRYPTRAELSTMAGIGGDLAAELLPVKAVASSCCGSKAKVAPAIEPAAAGCCGASTGTGAVQTQKAGSCC